MGLDDMQVRIARLFALALLLSASGADAAVRCGPHAEVLRWLDMKFAELPIGGGLITNMLPLWDVGQNQLAEILVSKAGTWSIIVTSPEGKSCLVIYGDNWRASTQRAERD